MADLYSCWVISLRKQQDFYGCEAQCIGGSKPNARSATLVQWRQFSLAFLLKLKQIYMYCTVTMPYLAASLVSVLPCSSQVFLCLNPVFFFFFCAEYRESDSSESWNLLGPWQQNSWVSDCVVLERFLLPPPSPPRGSVWYGSTFLWEIIPF